MVKAIQVLSQPLHFRIIIRKMLNFGILQEGFAVFVLLLFIQQVFLQKAVAVGMVKVDDAGFNALIKGVKEKTPVEPMIEVGFSRCSVHWIKQGLLIRA